MMSWVWSSTFFSDFQSSLQKFIQTVTERVENIEAYTLVGTTTMTIIPDQLVLERKIEELGMDHIADCPHIDVLESRINDGTDELLVGEVIIWSTQDLKAHLVGNKCEKGYFWGFVFPYNILTCIQYRLKGEETLEEGVKHKKQFSSLKISKYEAITF